MNQIMFVYIDYFIKDEHCDQLNRSNPGIRCEGQSEMMEKSEQQHEVFKSLNFYGDKIDEFNKQMVDAKKSNKHFEEMKQELTSVKDECRLLRDEIGNMHY
ncbi:hypothetical protein JTB14_035946 [Gonioctena quinquepunctata]|nr:hypothetical protein JTB14_035946 [Gonioctena quinquepunctata]